jgi:transposase
MAGRKTPKLKVCPLSLQERTSHVLYPAYSTGRRSGSHRYRQAASRCLDRNSPGWKSRKRLILPNAAAEFRLFADYLHGLKHPVQAIFEATGNYYRPLAYFLKSRGFQLELIAP